MDLTIRRPLPDEDISHLPAFDFTKLSAVNTCTRWGVIRYGRSLTTGSGGRAMALEAGTACHEVFSACRLFDLIEYGRKVYHDKDLRRLVIASADRLFGEERSGEFLTRICDESEDSITRVMNGALYILESSGYYDDPDDKRRTMQKLSEACTAFVDRYPYGRSVPYVSDDDSFVGVETPYELVAEYVYNGVLRTVRFYGRIDGVSCYRNDPTSLIIEEYKTASRLNDAWQMSFETSHQVTGYMVAAQTITRVTMNRARVTGLSIPLPVRSGESIVSLMVQRGQLQYKEWAKWFILTAEEYFKYIDDVFEAPMMTAQCNRYFRPCAFIPLCAARDEDERQEMFNLLEVEEWSPLHEKASD